MCTDEQCLKCGCCNGTKVKTIFCDGCGKENLQSIFERKGLIFCNQECFEKSFPGFAFFSEADQEFRKFANKIGKKLRGCPHSKIAKELLFFAKDAPQILWPDLKPAPETYQEIIRTSENLLYWDYILRTFHDQENGVTNTFFGKTFSARIFVQQQTVIIKLLSQKNENLPYYYFYEKDIVFTGKSYRASVFYNEQKEKFRLLWARKKYLDISANTFNF